MPELNNARKSWKHMERPSVSPCVRHAVHHSKIMLKHASGGGRQTYYAEACFRRRTRGLFLLPDFDKHLQIKMRKTTVPSKSTVSYSISVSLPYSCCCSASGAEVLQLGGAMVTSCAMVTCPRIHARALFLSHQHTKGHGMNFLGKKES